jgi:hypothetical protein
MPEINNVSIYQDNAFTNLIHAFPRGQTDEAENRMTCSDPTNATRPVQFNVGTRYYIRYTIVGTGAQRQWQGICTYEPGGWAGVSFEELELVD